MVWSHEAHAHLASRQRLESKLEAFATRAPENNRIPLSDFGASTCSCSGSVRTRRSAGAFSSSIWSCFNTVNCQARGKAETAMAKNAAMKAGPVASKQDRRDAQARTLESSCRTPLTNCPKSWTSCRELSRLAERSLASQNERVKDGDRWRSSF